MIVICPFRESGSGSGSGWRRAERGAKMIGSNSGERGEGDMLYEVMALMGADG